MAVIRICAVEGCGKKHSSRGFCYAHAVKFRKYGNPLAERKSARARGPGLKFLMDAMLKQTDECIFWPFGGKTTRYASIQINRRVVGVHRFICELANGPAEADGLEAAHSCNHPKCCNPRHLRWATTKENQHDRYEAGTHSIGERNAAAILSENDVRDVRDRIGQNESIASIALLYGVSRATIFAIKSGASWSWLR